MAAKSAGLAPVPIYDYKPQVRIELDPGMAGQFTIGKTGCVALMGKVVSLEERQDIGPDGKPEVYACVCLEDPTVKITTPNEFTELAEDD